MDNMHATCIMQVLTNSFCEYKEGVLVDQLIQRKHDEAIGDLEEVLTKLRMETNVTSKVWFSAAMRRIKEILRLVGGPDKSPLAGKGAVDARSLLMRMPWLKLRITKAKLKGYIHTTVGVNADPHELCKAWLLQYRDQLVDIFFYADSEDNLYDRVDDAMMTVVVIIDANVVSEDSKLGNTKGVFHTTAVVIKVIFWPGQDNVSDLILGVLYAGNDHYPEFQTHAHAWLQELCNMTKIMFTISDDGVAVAFNLPFNVVAVLPDGAGCRALNGNFSVGRYTLFDSFYHSLPNLIRFDEKYADDYGRPYYCSPTTGGDGWKKLFTDYARDHGVAATSRRYNYKLPSLLPFKLTEILNGLFHMELGLSKYFAARICETIKDCGIETVTAFVNHCFNCLKFFFRQVS